MAIDPINVTTEAAVQILTEVGKIGLWLQAIGFFLILWSIYLVYMIISSQKKIKVLNKIQQDFARIERKIDKLAKNK